MAHHVDIFSATHLEENKSETRVLDKTGKVDELAIFVFRISIAGRTCVAASYNPSQRLVNAPSHSVSTCDLPALVDYVRTQVQYMHLGSFRTSVGWNSCCNQ